MTPRCPHSWRHRGHRVKSQQETHATVAKQLSAVQTRLQDRARARCMSTSYGTLIQNRAILGGSTLRQAERLQRQEVSRSRGAGRGPGTRPAPHGGCRTTAAAATATADHGMIGVVIASASKQSKATGKAWIASSQPPWPQGGLRRTRALLAMTVPDSELAEGMN